MIALPLLISVSILANPLLIRPRGVSIETCASNSCNESLWQIAAKGGSSWRFGRIGSPDQKETFVSIIKTARTSQSDADFAGLMIRCSKGGKIDVLAVLVSPLPPKAHPLIIVQGDTGAPSRFEGTMATGGAAVLLPDSAGVLPGGSWRSQSSLSVTVRSDQSEVKGIVDLDGLPAAYNNLVASCS